MEEEEEEEQEEERGEGEERKGKKEGRVERLSAPSGHYQECLGHVELHVQYIRHVHKACT